MQKLLRNPHMIRHVQKEQLQTTYKQLAEAKRREANDEWRTGFVAKMDKDSTSSFISTLKRIRRGRQKGVTTEMDSNDLNSMANHFEKQFCPCVPTTNSTSPRQISPHEDYTESTGQLHGNDNELITITSDKVIELLKKCPRGKACGADSICVEMLGLPGKSAKKDVWNAHPIVKALVILFNRIL